MSTNFFAPKSAAERYTRGRPYFHPLVVERIKNFLSLEEPLKRAADVGCGTGLSAVALREIAREVVGVDASIEMLQHADKEIERFVADAAALPFRENCFDLMTLASAFHWLDRAKFLGEARRVLRHGGWLVVYDNYFSGRMEENAEFRGWYLESYLVKYPPPPRGPNTFEAEDLENEGFHLAGDEQHQSTLRFSVERLIDYLVTHSNVIAAVEGGREEISQVRRWMLETLGPLFGGLAEATFHFHGPISYLQKPA